MLQSVLLRRIFAHNLNCLTSTKLFQSQAFVAPHGPFRSYSTFEHRSSPSTPRRRTDVVAEGDIGILVELCRKIAVCKKKCSGRFCRTSTKLCISSEQNKGGFLLRLQIGNEIGEAEVDFARFAPHGCWGKAGLMALAVASCRSGFAFLSVRQPKGYHSGLLSIQNRMPGCSRAGNV